MQSKISEEYPLTRKLEEELHKIGFSIRNHGCDHFFIYNQYKKMTRFMVNDDRIRIESPIYGAKGSGSVSFNLRCCSIEHDEECQMVSVVMHDDRDEGEAFVSFYGRKR